MRAGQVLTFDAGKRGRQVRVEGPHQHQTLNQSVGQLLDHLYARAHAPLSLPPAQVVTPSGADHDGLEQNICDKMSFDSASLQLCEFVVSMRPPPGFMGWQAYHVHGQPLLEGCVCSKGACEYEVYV